MLHLDLVHIQDEYHHLSYKPNTYKHTHTHAHTDTQTHRHTDTQTHRHTDTQTHRHTDTQTHRHTDTQTHRHTDTQTHRHTDTHTHTLSLSLSRKRWRLTWNSSEVDCCLLTTSTWGFPKVGDPILNTRILIIRIPK